MNCRGYLHSFEWNERLHGGIEILWLEEEKFEDYFKIISQYSFDRQWRNMKLVPAWQWTLKSKLKLKYLEKKRFVSYTASPGICWRRSKQKNLSRDLRISRPRFVAVTAGIYVRCVTAELTCPQFTGWNSTWLENMLHVAVGTCLSWSSVNFTGSYVRKTICYRSNGVTCTE
jgi:hypothetical protein